MTGTTLCKLINKLKPKPKYVCNHFWVNIYPNKQVFHCTYCHRDLYTDDRGFLVTEPTPRKARVTINNIELWFDNNRRQREAN